MTPTPRAIRPRLLVVAAVTLAANAAFAESPQRLDAGMLSGLGIRYIGSAAMRGRGSASAGAHR